MARMRSVKPEFWGDQALAEHVSREARLLYIGLWNLADEHSRLRGDARYIKGQIFAYDDDLSAKDIAAMLDELADFGRVVAYEVAGERYLCLPKLKDHQRLEPDKVPSRLPAPPGSGHDDNPSESRADESAPRADELSLSRQHVAGGMRQAAGQPRADQPAPDATIAAARLIVDATAITPADALATAQAVAVARKPRNLPGLVTKLIDAGEIGSWITTAQAQPARAPCPRHGRNHCAECRSEAIAQGAA